MSCCFGSRMLGKRLRTAAQISGNGRYVTFTSRAPELLSPANVAAAAEVSPDPAAVLPPAVGAEVPGGVTAEVRFDLAAFPPAEIGRAHV